jgi:signal recognition particle GTPase
MALERLGASLHEALRKLFRAAVVDEAAVKELVRDVQRGAAAGGRQRSACLGYF